MAGQYGPSRDGDPVYGEDYDDAVHYADGELDLIRDLPLRLAFDQGVTGPAMLICQYTYAGQLRVLEEVVPGRMGPTRFGELCKIRIDERYGAIPSMRWLAVCDPAGFSGGDTEGGDLAWAETVATVLGIVIRSAETNEQKARIDGVSRGIIPKPITPDALFKSLAPADAAAGDAVALGERRYLDAETYLNTLGDTLGFAEDERRDALMMATTKGGLRLIERMMRSAGVETSVTVEGRGKSGGEIAAESLKARLSDERNNASSPKFDRAFQAETDRQYKVFYG